VDPSSPFTSLGSLGGRFFLDEVVLADGVATVRADHPDGVIREHDPVGGEHVVSGEMPGSTIATSLRLRNDLAATASERSRTTTVLASAPMARRSATACFVFGSAQSRESTTRMAFSEARAERALRSARRFIFFGVLWA